MQNNKQCFTSIQSRKLLGRLESFQLCPSMDLVVHGTTPSSSPSSSSLPPQQQHLYRTMSWQKVASITPNTMVDTKNNSSNSSNDNDNDNSNDTAEDTTMTDPTTATTVAVNTTNTTTCWSPSGRWIAVAVDQTVSLYGVEPLANPPGGGSSSMASDGTSPTEAQHSWTVDRPVTGLVWAHVGRAHPTAWNEMEDETEAEISWRYQSMYVDSTKFFLPPSGYLHPSNDDEDDHHRHQEQTTTTTALPESKTPLSVLCLSTSKHLELYLHGRYRLVTIDMNDDSYCQQVAVSNDLSYFLVQSSSSTSGGGGESSALLSLYHLPFLKRDRFPLQIVASLQGSISSHLATLRTSIVECANSWKSSLKPLDMKLQPLLQLLKNYSVDDLPLGVILKQYILVGHTSESSSVANAMDQFFTSIQMNDQLLQRMERSLHGALANVESQARKGLLSPTQALCYEIQELAGHVQYHYKGGGSAGHGAGDDDDEDADGSSPVALQHLIQFSRQLWLSVQTLILSIVQGRLQIRDFCGWLRSAGSQIKARGTASNSVQRENAKKRRVPQAVLERLLSSLNTFPLPSTGLNPAATATTAGLSLSEHLLNITTSTLLKDTTELIPLHPNSTNKASSSTIYSNSARGENPEGERPESPSSVLGLVTSVPTVGRACHLAGEAFLAVMDNPLSNVPKSMVPIEFRLPSRRRDSSTSSSSCVSLHMRIGGDVPASNDYDDPWNDEEDNDSNEKEGERSYFSPKVCSNDNPSPEEAEPSYCRQWSVIAQAQESTVQLFAIPLGWRDPEDEDLDFDEDLVDDDGGHTTAAAGSRIPFYLAVKLTLPTGGIIRDVGFYGDDGKSSLSSGNDSGTGKEGRQKLGILYQQPHDDSLCDGDDHDAADSPSARLDLWLVSYDDLIWQLLPFESSSPAPSLIDASQVAAFASCSLRPTMEGDETASQTEDESCQVLHAQTRTISKLESPDAAACHVQLMLCGSRGVGAVSVGLEGATTIELLDLEEDEEPDEDDDDDEGVSEGD